MLAHHLQAWLGSKTALAKSLIFAGRHRQLDTLTQCYFNVGTVLQNMAQHLTNIGSVHYVDHMTSNASVHSKIKYLLISQVCR